MVFTNPYTFLCAGHDFGENDMGMIFPPNLLPSTTGFYFTYIPVRLVHVYTQFPVENSEQEWMFDILTDI